MLRLGSRHNLSGFGPGYSTVRYSKGLGGEPRSARRLERVQGLRSRRQVHVPHSASRHAASCTESSVQGAGH